MPKPLISYVRNIDLFVARLWVGLKWVTMAIICVLAYAVIVRHVLQTPSIVAYELSLFIMTGGFILAGGPLLLQDEHVRMDALYTRWSPRKRAIVDVATFALLTYIIIMITTGIVGTYGAYVDGLHTKSVWGPPLWPLKAVITAGAVILLLQAIANLIRDIATIRGRPLS